MGKVRWGVLQGATLTHKALGPRAPLTKQRHTTWAGARMLADDATVKRH